MERNGSEMEQDDSSEAIKSVTPTSLQVVLSQMSDQEPMECDQNDSNFGSILQFHLDNIPGAEKFLLNINTLEHVAIHCDDYIEPSAGDFITCVRNRHKHQNLYRKTGPHIAESYAHHLDELSFIKFYPTGTHRFEFPREEILDYCQSLLQRGDRRFQDPDFIFYCLSRVETYKLFQMCNEVSDLETDRPVDRLLDDQTSVDLTFKGMRGSSFYWRSYSGDMIAIIAQLGLPTFFLTMSYDDLNSFDAINALWKAKHGSEAEIDPENLSYAERKQLSDEHPVAAARHFSYTLRKFLKL